MKILIACQHFAPETGAQALQATKVADALHEAGCQVQVLCGTQLLPVGYRRYPVMHVPAPVRAKPESLLQRMRWRAGHEIESVHRRAAWVREMAGRVVRLDSTFNADVVMTQSTPFRSHLIGLALPRSLRQRWVAYFSDLWPLSLTPYPYRTRLSMALKPLQMHALHSVLSAARGVLVSSGTTADRLVDEWPAHMRPECCVVPHIGTPAPVGPPDPALLERYGSRIVHVGKLTRERVFPQLIDAIRLYGAEGRGDGAISGFSFIGDVDPSFRLACVDLEQRGLVDFTDEVGPDVAQEISRAARGLAVIEARMEESPFLPSKFADYATLRKPILAVSPAGPVRDYLALNGGGVAVSHDAKEIADAIRLFGRSPLLDAGSETLATHFSAQYVAGRYVEAFRRLI